MGDEMPIVVCPVYQRIIAVGVCRERSLTSVHVQLSQGHSERIGNRQHVAQRSHADLLEVLTEASRLVDILREEIGRPQEMKEELLNEPLAFGTVRACQATTG